MGKIILCRGKKADTPLTVLQTGVKLYTAEELCYYIYNNIYLIGQDFIDDNLISFLDETGEKELAERVRKLKETGGSLAQIFVIILKTIDYYSVAEIEQLKEILNTLGKQSVCERLKARGDGYLNAGYYFAAVRCYESIIKDYKGKDLLAADYAKVYHNLGTAYARMFMYDKAVIYYDEAYRTGQHEESKKCSIAALIMAKKDKEPVNVDVDEDEYVVQKELETLMDNARYSDEYRELEDIARLKAEGIPVIPHRAVQMTLDDYEEYDYLIGMDTENIRNMQRISGGDPDEKIYKLLTFAGSGLDVADPWYTGDFEATYKDVKAGCEGLLHTLAEEI